MTRRQILRVAGGVAGAAAVGAGAFEAVRLSGAGGTSLPSLPVRASGPVRTFHSRPDLHPPAMTVTRPQHLDSGFLFMGPWAKAGNQPGPLIVDHQAEPVWFRPLTSDVKTNLAATNFRPFTYRGEPVLAWWQGQNPPNGFGRGEAVIVDRSYREVARVRAAGGRQMDLHEFQLTPQGTALFTCYPETVPADLRSIGGPRQGRVLNSILQEVDVRTGRLLLEWRALDHIPVSDSYQPMREPYDYLHLNSVGLTPDGNLLVSARDTSALYKVDRRTGQVIWRLGGRRSDFTIDREARFSVQHHARQPADGTITVFDNVTRLQLGRETSRGLVLKLDEAGRSVSLGQAFNHDPLPLLAIAMGSVQILPSGRVIVGWGAASYASEFTSTGRLLTDAALLSGFWSYRSFLLPWRATPQDVPDVAVQRNTQTGKTILYASWNGDTETAYWQVHVGPRQSDMRPIGTARRRAFETAIPLGNADGYFAVTALDAAGRPLGHSGVVRG